MTSDYGRNDRLAVLIFRVSDDTTDDVAEGVVTMMDAPPDWGFESASVVTSEDEFKRLTWGMWT